MGQDFSYLRRAQPDYQAEVRYRRPGYRPRSDLMARIKRFHPTVDLVFETKSQRWVLVQMDRHPIHVISVLRGRRGEFVAPNMENTVGMLDRCSSINFGNKWAVDRWIAENLSDEVSDPDAEARAESNINEFSERVWRLEHPKLSVRPDPKPVKEA